MSGPQFFETQMGHQFFLGTMPALVREIARLNDNLERLTTALANREPPGEPTPHAGVSQPPAAPR